MLGYLLRCEDISLLPDAIRQVAKGCQLISPTMACHLNKQSSKSAGSAELTQREFEVLRLMAQGFNNAEIAGQLNISKGTVKNHIANIYDKLGIANERAAVAFAWRAGLMSPS